MSYHIVSIDSPQCSISCRDGQLVCKTGDGEKPKVLPLEDVASIIITSFSANIHSHLFLEAAKHGVALIICEAFKPVSLVLPANRSTDTLLSRALLTLSEGTRQQLWQRTVDAKCQNQASLAEHIAPDDEQVEELRRTAFGRKPHKEAICAKAFWHIYGSAVRCAEFAREQRPAERTDATENGDIMQQELLLTQKEERKRMNDFLNYGYAVLLSTVLQKLFAVGLDPTWGLSHAPRERSTPLAYDLMEPFRPCVDWRVFQWLRDHANRTEWEVNKEFRKWVTAFPLERVDYMEFTLEIQGVIEGVVRSFRRAVLEGQPRYYRPWTPKNSKWAG
jgi:CRISP-associated protein Cas1